MLEHDDGILSAPTGFGKTVIGAYLISRLRLPTLVIVPRCALVSQWAEKLSEFLSVEHPDGPLLTPSGKPSERKRLVVGQIGAGKKKISGIIDIATSQALIEKDLEMILKATPARRIFGLSATPKRSDGLNCALYMLCGPIRCTIDPKEQAAQQGFKRILRPVFTRIRVPGCGDGASYNQILDKLCANEARNRLIATDIVEVARRGGTPLVLTKRKEHARRLARLISGEGRTVHLLIGEGTAAARRKLIAEATREEAEGPSIIVATEGYLGEGFDFSKLDALFLTTPISWDGNVTQQAGRLHRTHKGKSQVAIWDYVDSSVPMLERMYKKRLKTYAKLGYEVELAQPGREEERAEFVTAGDAVRMLAARRLLRSRSLRRVRPEKLSNFWGRRCRTLSQGACAFRARSRETPPRRLPACSRRWGQRCILPPRQPMRGWRFSTRKPSGTGRFPCSRFLGKTTAASASKARKPPMTCCKRRGSTNRAANRRARATFPERRARAEAGGKPQAGEARGMAL